MPTEFRAIAVIPARWDSSRFPGKPLEKIRGRPMIEWVVEQAQQARRIAEVIVATDDDRIRQAVISFGGRAVMTSRHHSSGTDRVAEASVSLNCNVVVNVQGDEPLIPPENIDRVVEPFLSEPRLNVATLKIRLQSERDLCDPNVTKVVTDEKGFALYFSRAPIPFDRDRWGNLWSGRGLNKEALKAVPVYKHLGIYGYSRSFLMEFHRIPRSYLEDLERLEQLRILSNGIAIRVLEVEKDSIGVDCPEDLKKVEQWLNH